MKISALNQKYLLFLLNVLPLPFLYFIAPKLPKVSVQSKFSLPAFLVVWCLIVILHECLHFMFLKVFDPSARVYFGFKSFCPYAMSRGGYYTKGQFIWALLAPFVVINSLLLVLGLMGVVPLVYTVVLLLGHTYGCNGDFLMTWQTLKVPSERLITDDPTSVGFMVADE